MPNEWIPINAMKTALLLPVVCILATIVISFIVSFFSLKKADEITHIGLRISLIACAVSWFIYIVNYFALR